MPQRSYFKSRPDLLTLAGVGGGNRKTWITLRVEESGLSLVDRISKCPRYMIDKPNWIFALFRRVGGRCSVLLDVLGR